jgi:threonine dehydratase
MAGKKVGVILSGGNMDSAPFDKVLGGGTPQLS